MSEPERKMRVKGKDREVVWSPTPKQSEFLSAPEREVLFGGSLGGSKTDGCLACALIGIENPKHRALFLRRSFPQLRSAMERAFELYKPCGGQFNVQTSTWTFPSGSKIEFAFLDSPHDRWRYAGRAFNTLIFDELCEWENPDSYVYLMTRLRTTKNSGLRLMVRASANPLGPGASWVRSRWQIPGDGSASECEDPDTHLHRRFIPARISDNPHLAPGYIQTLQGLSSAHKKALIDGRWDCVSGSCFEDFDHKIHVVDEFPIPVSWDLWRGCDPGWRAPSAVLWLAWDKDGTDTIYVIAELYETHLTPEALAAKIRRIDFSLPIDLGDETILNDEELSGTIDSAAFSDSGMGSVGDELNKRGLRFAPCEKGQNSRIHGINMIHERLAARPDGTVGLKIFRNCKALIAELPSLTYDPNGGEDVDQNCASDHCFDALRYSLTYKRPWFKKVKLRFKH